MHNAVSVDIEFDTRLEMLAADNNMIVIKETGISDIYHIMRPDDAMVFMLEQLTDIDRAH